MACASHSGTPAAFSCSTSFAIGELQRGLRKGRGKPRANPGPERSTEADADGRARREEAATTETPDLDFADGCPEAANLTNPANLADRSACERIAVILNNQRCAVAE